MDYTIIYPTSFDEIDPKDDNMDVCVRFVDGREYTLVFATPQNIITQMAGEGKRYLEPGLPFLYVKELTETNIEDCIAAIAGDRSLMNLYGGDLGNIG